MIYPYAVFGGIGCWDSDVESGTICCEEVPLYELSCGATWIEICKSNDVGRIEGGPKKQIERTTTGDINHLVISCPKLIH